jgi:hypothetical protein
LVSRGQRRDSRHRTQVDQLFQREKTLYMIVRVRRNVGYAVCYTLFQRKASPAGVALWGGTVAFGVVCPLVLGEDKFFWENAFPIKRIHKTIVIT